VIKLTDNNKADDNNEGFSCVNSAV